MVLQARNFSRPKRMRVATISMQNSAPATMSSSMGTATPHPAPLGGGKSHIQSQSAAKTQKLITQVHSQSASLLSASRRRRARANGSVHAPKFAVIEAKKRSLAAAAATADGSGSKKLFLTDPLKGGSSKRRMVEEDKSEDQKIGVEIPVPDVEMVDVQAQAQGSSEEKTPTRPAATVKTQTVHLPRFIVRPESSYKEIAPDALSSLDSELEGVDIGFVRDGLAELGPGMMRVLSSVQVTPVRDALPSSMSVLVRDVSSDLPSHLLAIYGPPGPPAAQNTAAPKRKVTLYATHSIVLTAFCSNLPTGIFSPSATPGPDLEPQSEAGDQQVTLPVIPLCLPDPTTFPNLARYIYTRNGRDLVQMLLPQTWPVPESVLGPELADYYDDDETLCELDSDTENEDDDSDNDSLETLPSAPARPHSHYNSTLLSKEERRALDQFTTQLSSLPATTILGYAMRVHGLAKNGGVLGLCDDGFWRGLSRCWGVLVAALEQQASGTAK